MLRERHLRDFNSSYLGFGLACQVANGKSWPVTKPVRLPHPPEPFLANFSFTNMMNQSHATRKTKPTTRTSISVGVVFRHVKKGIFWSLQRIVVHSLLVKP
jgi:hypothetical protein